MIISSTIFPESDTIHTLMGVYQALAVLAGHYLDVDDTEHCEDEDSFLLDWSSLTESVPLLPDPLPPFTLGTRVRKGEWSKQSSTPDRDGREEDGRGSNLSL